MISRATAWARRNMPTRESFARIGWLRPIAHHILRPELWRFTRRSVPRGVAVGLLIGIFLMIPGLQMIPAALLSVPLRANVPLAVAMTFLSNPLTTPFILLASLPIGNSLGFHADTTAFYALYERGAEIGEWLSWLASDAAPALLVGLFVIAAVSALSGYLIASFGWRWWTARKWRTRHGRSDG